MNINEIQEARQHATDSNIHRSFAVYGSLLQEDIHALAVEKGWWDKPRSDAEAIALMHSELSEALEYLRKDSNERDDKIPEFLGVEAELADTIIRIMDLAGARGWNVMGALVAKHKFNATRSYRHGKKF